MLHVNELHETNARPAQELLAEAVAQEQPAVSSDFVSKSE